MRTTDQINELVGALAKAQGEMTGAAKSANNPFHRSKYADLASVMDACRGPLSKYGLAVVQFPNTEFSGEPEIYEWVAKNSGEKRTGVRVKCVVSLTTRLMHASGQFMEDTMSTILASGDAQAIGSAITYLRRYALQSIVGIAAEDDDGEGAQRPRNGHAYRDEAPAEPQRSDVPPDDSFVDWWKDTIAVADKGVDALKARWESAPKDYQRYVSHHLAEDWRTLKAQAGKVSADAAKEPAGVA